MQVHQRPDARSDDWRAWLIESRRTMLLRHDCVLPMRTAGLIYLVSGALLITFSQGGALSQGMTATMLFEDELFDFAWLKFLPGCVIRSISNETHAVVIDEREQLNLPIDVTNRAAALTARLSRQLIAVTALSLEDRLSSLLIKFGAWMGQMEQGRLGFDFPVPRDSLAAFVGVRPETLSRTIRQAEKNAMISLRGWRHVEVHDWPAMCRSCPISSAIMASVPERRLRYLQHVLQPRIERP